MGLKALEQLAIKLTNDLVHKFGGDAVITNITKTDGGFEQPNTVTETSVNVDCTPPTGVRTSKIDGKAIIMGDLETYIRADQASVSVDDRFTYNGSVYTIAYYETISGGNEPAMYYLVLRQ
jgi:hypothetical protein